MSYPDFIVRSLFIIFANELTIVFVLYNNNNNNIFNGHMTFVVMKIVMRNFTLV